MRKFVIGGIVVIFLGFAVMVGISSSKKISEKRRLTEVTRLISSFYPITVIDDTTWSSAYDTTAYKLFEKIGWIKIGKWAYSSWFGRWSGTKWIPGKYVKAFNLTDEGKKYIELVEGLAGKDVRIKICKKVFIGITGIMMQGGNVAKVTYRWKYGDFCPHYQEIKKLYKKGYLEEKYENYSYENTVICEHYNTGWKIKQ